MAEITASMVKELREKTDAPMMECKKALTEAGGDLAKAEEILRVKLGNKASKAAARVAAEGVVAVNIDGKVGAIVEVNSETDFVAKNDDFLKFAQGPRRHSWRRAIRPTSLRCRHCRSARRYGRDDAHRTGRQDRREHGDPPLCARRGARDTGKLRPWRQQDRRAARHLRRQTPNWPRTWPCTSQRASPSRSMRAAYPADLLDAERRIAIEKAREAGKPEAMLEKIAEGTVQKFLKEVTLLGQVFVKAEDGKQTIEQLLKAKGAKVNRVRALRRRRGHREEAERLRRRSRRASCRCAGLSGTRAR